MSMPATHHLMAYGLVAALIVIPAVEAAAQAPSQTTTVGGAVTGTVIVPQSRAAQGAARRRTVERAEGNPVDESAGLIGPVSPSSGKPARQYSAQTVDAKLRALDRQAARGKITLEAYRAYQRGILRGE